MPKMKQQQFYCVYCGKKVTKNKDDIKFKMAKSSKRPKIPMLKSKCSKCDTKLNKFVKLKDAKTLSNKYRK